MTHGAADRSGGGRGRRPLVLLSLLMWLVFPGDLVAQASNDEWGIGSAIDTLLAEISPSGFDGAILISVDGHPVFRKGYGRSDLEGTIPVTPETPFWVASVSKQFAAAAILRLEEQGILSVDAPIDRFIPGLPADKRSITLDQLLTHTGGLEQHYAADGIRDRGEAIRAILQHPLVFTPGDGFAYSNDSYNLLAAIVEIASGQPYEDFVRQRLLEPAGMIDTGFWGPPDHPEVASIRWPAFPDSSVLQPNWGFRGGVGMSSTVDDLHRWYHALVRGDVLSEDRVRRLMIARVDRGDIGVGYGWFTSTDGEGVESVWTRGYESFGHGAVLSSYPEFGLVVVVASSSGEAAGGRPVTHVLTGKLAEIAFRHR